MDALLFVLTGAVVVMMCGWTRSRYAGFLAQNPDDYSDRNGPQFDVRTHLNGPIICEGVIFGPTGRVSSRFIGEFDCKWEGNTGVMDEVFTYDDGSTQTRAWRLTIGNDGKILAVQMMLLGMGRGNRRAVQYS